MPEFAQLEQPQQKQQPTKAIAFDPAQVRLQALSEVTLLLEKCKTQLRESKHPPDPLSSFPLPVKSEHRKETVDIYTKVVEETNGRLRNEKAPVFLYLEHYGDRFNFVAGHYVQSQERGSAAGQEVDIHLSEQTAKVLLALVNEDMRNHESAEKYQPRIQRLGNAIIRVMKENVALQNDVEKIATPEELATAMLSYKDGKTKDKLEANCIGVSLLTNELLRLSGFESSIINIHAINKYGEQMDGHATAAVVVDGWLIDPALQIQTKKISKITLDKKDKNYQKFARGMEGIYLVELGNDKERPVALEFSEDKQDNELRSLYLLENGIKLRTHGKTEDGNSSIVEAAKLNPKNFYASSIAANLLPEDKIDATLKTYRQCADLNPGLYLANVYAAIGISNLARSTDSMQLMDEAYGYSKKALDMQPDAVLPALRHVIIASYLKKNDESEPLAQKFYDSLPEGSSYKKLFEPYLAKK